MRTPRENVVVLASVENTGSVAQLLGELAVKVVTTSLALLKRRSAEY